MFNLRLIHQVMSQTPCAPPVTGIQDDVSTHDFDRVMANVSIRLDQDSMVDRIIGKRDMQKLKIKGTTW